MNLRRNPLLITIVACLLAMSVTPAVLAKDDGKPAVSAVDAPLAAYEPVEIAFRDAPGHPEDFVMIVRKRALRFPVGAHIYLESKKDGSLTFDGLPPGEYEAQLWGGERGRVIAKSPAFSVNGEWREPEEPTSVWAEKSFYAPDEAIVAHFADAWVREETDHLLLAPATTSEHRWPIRGVVSLTTPRGSLVFGRPRPGAYELRLYRGSSKEVVARFALSVGESLAATYPEMAGGTLAAAQGWRDRCEVLSDWATGYELPEQGTEMTALQVYTQPFADSAFVPVFGVPLDELKPETLEFIIKTVRPQCRELDRSYREALDYDVLGGFDADPHPMSRRAVTYESTVASVKQRRSADRLLAKGAARLDALAMDANAYAEVLRVEKRYVPTGWASAGAKEHFLDTLARTRTAAADMALEDGVGRLVATASGLEGAHRLDALQRDNARLISDASETVAAAALDRLEKAIGEQLQETLANYTTRLEQTGEGAEGVRAMARLYHEASDTLGGLMKREAVQPFMARFVERERALIPAAVPELVEDIASLPTLQASHDYRVRGLGRPEAWKLVENTQLPVALKKRQVELWAQLEASGEKIWPLSDGVSPGEELLRRKEGSPRPPMGHEILLALIREIDQANGERVSSNAVIYRLLPLNVALGAGGISTFNMPRIEMPVEARMSFYRLHDVQCSRLSAQGGWPRYECGYRVSADVEGIVGAQGLFSQRMKDVFEFSGGRWRSPSMQERLRQVSVLTWGDIADNVNRGLGAASCIGAAFGGIVDTSCY